MGSSVAAIIVAKQNQYMRRFQEAGAVSPDTAADLGQVGCRDSRLFRTLVSKGIVREASSGKYYIDLKSACEFRSIRLQRALTALVIISGMAALLAVCFATR